MALPAPQAHAQSDTTDAMAIPACTTSTGIKGKLFTGLFGTITSPESFDTIETNNEDFTAYTSVKSGLENLVHPGVEGDIVTRGGVTKDFSSEGTVTILKYIRDNNTVAHQCAVEVIDFNPDLHELSATSFGNCDLKQLHGFSQLIPDHIQIYETPEEIVEMAFAPEDIIGIFKLPSSIVEIVDVYGRSPGIGNFMWMSGRPGNYYLAGICPFEVENPDTALLEQEVENALKCRDVKNEPLMLKVGDTATLSLSEYTRNIDRRGMFFQASRPIAITSSLDTLRDEKADMFDIKAIIKGTMTLIRKTGDARFYETCVITVN